VTITLMVITDGRADCLARTLASADNHLKGPITDRVIVNDSLDPAYQRWLKGQYGYRYRIIGPELDKRGFGGAIQAGWDAVIRGDYIAHLEDDFLFNRDVNLTEFMWVLEQWPTVAQVACLRQPWNDEERRAGGIVECHPGDYIEWSSDSMRWLTHLRCFTTNPCLYRRSLTVRGWPQVEHSEGIFTHQLVNDGLMFAYWGSKGDPPLVHHIGDKRVGCGY
jgi:hypothetical protein